MIGKSVLGSSSLCDESEWVEGQRSFHSHKNMGLSGTWEQLQKEEVEVVELERDEGLGFLGSFGANDPTEPCPQIK